MSKTKFIILAILGYIIWYIIMHINDNIGTLIFILHTTLLIYLYKKKKKNNINPVINKSNSEYNKKINNQSEILSENKSEYSNKEKLSTNISNNFSGDDFVVIDIETTGLSSINDKIIEISAIRFENNNITDTFSTLINPGITIPNNITSITGISNDMIKSSPKIEEIIDDYIKFIKDDIIIGHNISFDLGFINNNLNKLGKKSISNDYVDTLQIARKKIKDVDNHKLTTLINYYNLSSKQEHRALSDCKLTGEIFIKLKEDTGNRTLVPLPDQVKSFIGITKAHLVKENENDLYYKIPDEYKQEITDMILKLNDYINESKQLINGFKPLNFKKDDIIFEPFDYTLVYNKEFDIKSKVTHPFTKVKESVYTGLKNLKKHPFIVEYYTKRKYTSGSTNADEIFGNIFIDKNSNISKIEIIHWNSSNLHIIYCVSNNDNVVIDRIQSVDKNGNKFLKYKR